MIATGNSMFYIVRPNPQFVEYMMGFMTDHTECGESGQVDNSKKFCERGAE
jgi:hypothetical protein